MLSLSRAVLQLLARAVLGMGRWGMPPGISLYLINYVLCIILLEISLRVGWVSLQRAHLTTFNKGRQGRERVILSSQRVDPVAMLLLFKRER